MEDTHCIVDKIGNDATCGLFCIFDGHGGRQVSDHCAERFPDLIRKQVQTKPADLTKPLETVFQTVSLTQSNIFTVIDG